MTLQYAEMTMVVREIEEQLQTLSLDYQKEQIPTAIPILVDGKDKIIGKKAIFAHLALLEKELHSWYYCDC